MCSFSNLYHYKNRPNQKGHCIPEFILCPYPIETIKWRSGVGYSWDALKLSSFTSNNVKKTFEI